MGVGMSLTPLPALGLPCPALVRGFVPILIVSCYAMFS